LSNQPTWSPDSCSFEVRITFVEIIKP
jgi:hypothetical protein